MIAWKSVNADGLPSKSYSQLITYVPGYGKVIGGFSAWMGIAIVYTGSVRREFTHYIEVEDPV